MWLLTSIAKKTAQRIANDLGGIARYTGSFLNEYPWVVELSRGDVAMNVEVHGTGKKVRVLLPRFRNKRKFTCSFGAPADPSFNQMLTDVLPGGPSVHVPSALGEGNANLVKRFCASQSNRADIQALALEEGELLAISACQMLASLTCSARHLPGDRVESIFSLCWRSAARKTVDLFLGMSYRVVVGAPLPTDAAPTSEGHLFGSLIGDAIPRCKNCNTRVHVLLTIDLSDPVFGKACAPAQRIPIVTCLNCDAYTMAQSFSYSQNVLHLLDQAEGTCFGEFPEHLPPRSVLIRPDDGLAESATRHRLGGRPDWIQGVEVFECVKCGEDMAFFAQVDTDDDLDIQFGDNGRLYALVCAKCEVVTTVVQSH